MSTILPSRSVSTWKRSCREPFSFTHCVEPHDHLVADSGELGPDVDSPVAAFADLEGQDLTGLVGAVSGRCAFPPEVAMRDAAPIALICDLTERWAAVGPRAVTYR